MTILSPTDRDALRAQVDDLRFDYARAWRYGEFDRRLGWSLAYTNKCLAGKADGNPTFWRQLRSALAQMKNLR